VLPPINIGKELQEEIKRQTRMMAADLGVVGLMNVQYAIKDGEIYILEVNPRASRTVPFVSKAIGFPLAKLATKVMLGKSLKELGFDREVEPRHLSVKEAVLPFTRFPNVDLLLGPEMKSTGEVMGIGTSFGIAFAKAQSAAGYDLPVKGTVFVSVHDHDKPGVLPVARKLVHLGFRLVATRGTSTYLKDNGIPADTVFKLKEGRPHVMDLIKNGEIQLVINTSLGKKTSSDSYEIRRTTLVYNIPYATTIAGAEAIAEAVEELQRGDWDVKTIQEYHAQ
jgi:carbamoyl-phosphate synthase large subunit